MKNKFLKTAIALISLSAFASGDLTLEGERWEAKHTGYKCGAFSSEAQAPLSHQRLNVNFEVLRTDKTLDNGLVLASFEVGGSKCRYSALLLADNDASTIKLVDSKAYSLDEGVSCEEGRQILDENLASNDYLYWGHPHHVTIMMPVHSAEEICGSGATHVGLDFTVSRFLGRR